MIILLWRGSTALYFIGGYLGLLHQQAFNNLLTRKDEPMSMYLQNILLLLCTFATLHTQAGVLEDEEKYPNIVRPVLTVGGYPDEGKLLKDPIAAAYSEKGELFIVEAGNHRISEVDTNGKVLQTIGEYGTGRGKFVAPTAIAIQDGEIYVTDSGASRVSVFSLAGKFLRDWGSFGDGPGQFKDPRGISVRNGHVVVADTGNNRVQILDRSGNHRLTINNDSFNEPSSVVITRNEQIWVADTHSNRIVAFDLRTGHVKRSIGVYGSYPGQFAEPISIAAHGSELFVADLVNHRVQVFTDDGQFRYTFARHPTFPREGNGRVHYPLGIAVSPDGRLVAICESFENRVQIFSSEAVKKNYVAVTDSAWWDKYPQFHYGRRLKIALGKDMRIPWPGDVMTMSEPDTHKVIIFDVSGEAPFKLAEFGEFGEKIGQLKGPHGVGVNVFGEMFITDSFNHRVVALDLSRMTLSSQMQRIASELRTLKITSAPEMNKYLKPLTPPVLRVFGKRGNALGEFNTPSSGSAVSTNAALQDLVFIGDTRNHRIQVFKRDGTFTGRVIGGYGTGSGQLNLPTDLVVDNKHGVLYVVEAFNRRVSAFDAESLQFKFHLGSPGVDEGQFMAPSGAAVDMDGNVYVTDQGTHKISRFSPVVENGTVTRTRYVGRWGQYGVEPGSMLYPQGITIDSKNRVYVVDFGNHRGQIFDREGKFLRIFGEQILSPSGDQFPVTSTATLGASTPTSNLMSAPKSMALSVETARVPTNGKGYVVIVSPVVSLKAGQIQSVDVEVTRPTGGAPLVDLAVDARMEEHNHGMNVTPAVRRLAQNKFRVDGLLFHMLGDWTLYFDVKGANVTERAQLLINPIPQ